MRLGPFEKDLSRSHISLPNPLHSSGSSAVFAWTRLRVAPGARFWSSMTALAVDGRGSIAGTSLARSRRPSDGAVGDAGEALLVGVARRQRGYSRSWWMSAGVAYPR